MTTLEGLRTLIIDAHTEHRSRLRQALASVIFKGKIEQARSESEAYEILKFAKDQFHCIFISSILPCNSVASFISQAKEHQSGSLSAYIVSLAPEHVKSGEVAKFFLDGAQGFISEPYSAQEIQELIGIACAQKEKERQDLEKRVGAVDILSSEAMQIIDVVATLLSKGKLARVEKRELAKATELFRETASSLPEWELAKILVKRFEDAPIPKGYIPRKITRLKLEEALHPGAHIKKIMKDRKLSEDRIRANLKMDQAVFDAILEETGKVDEPIARELARIFGQGYNFWLEAQKKFDAKKAEEESGE